MSQRDRFWSKVDASGDCWEWLAAKDHGYGKFWLDGAAQWAHRVAYSETNGPIPEGMAIDHLCRNRACVNPAHMELVTQAVNNRRAGRALRTGECPQGHALTPDNLYASGGARKCRRCTLDRRRALMRARRKQVA